MNEIESESELPAIIHGLDDRPPLGRSFVLAIQHVLTMFGATVAVPLMLGPAGADGSGMGMSLEQVAVLISSVMVCSGIATFIQATFGSRLPIIQGVSFSFLAAFLGVIATIKGEGGSPAEMMQYIAGAILVGAVLEMTIGFSGLIGIVRKFLSPVVIGPVIMLIGLALYKAGAPMAGESWPISILTIVLVILFSYVLAKKHSLFRLFPILLAILISVGVCGLLTMTGVVDATSAVYIKTEHVGAANWLRVQPTELFLPWGVPKFRAGFILAVLAGYLASMIESYGDYHACSQMSGGGDPTPQQLSRGIGCEGLGCAITGLLGGFSSTSYSENIGLIGITKVGSRFVVQISAVILILLGLLGKFGAIAASIPKPIVGGLYCTLFGLISAVGIKELTKADLNVDRNLFVAGFALFMGLSVPHYFSSPAGLAAMGQLAEVSVGLKDIVSAIGNTGMAVAAIIGLVLDNLLPATAKERGLVN
ncbi:MAG: nucleobase transporter 1/2 [Mariniblastus sp.]|jgi:nucleobase transporter 1/2